MSSATEKYMSPGVILPLEISVYKDVSFSASFNGPKHDVPMSATFVIPETVTNVITVVPGTALAVTNGSTVTIVSQTVISDTGLMLGFQLSGDTDAVYQVTLNGTLLHRFTTNIVNPNISYTYPQGIGLNQGDILRILVSNGSGATADFSGAIIGSF